MKKITCILFTSIFALYLGGVQLLYWIKIDIAKREAYVKIQNNTLNKSDIKEFEFTVAQYKALKWLEIDKEFVFEGQRYDINRSEYVSEEIKLSCFCDNEETESVNAFQKLADRLFTTHQQANGNDNDILDKITKEYIPLNLTFNFSCFEKHYHSFISTEIYLPIPLPDNIWHPPTRC